MIATGIALIIIAILTRNGLVWTFGFLLLLPGLITLLLGLTGHRVGGRRHYF